MRNLFHGRRRLAVIGAATAIALAGGGAAFAFFTSSGSGTGSGSVGSPSNWSVVAASPVGTLYPCSAPATCTGDTQTITFTITNTGSGNQELQTAMPSIDTDGAGIWSGGTVGNAVADPPVGATGVPDCLSTWFTVTDTPTFTPVDVPASGTTTVTVTIALEDANTSQNACESTDPDVFLGVS